MFRTKARQLLRVPVMTGQFKLTGDLPANQAPSIAIRYVTPAEQQAMIDRHTQKVFYPHPVDINYQLAAARGVLQLPEVQTRIALIAESLSVTPQVIHDAWQAVTREFPVTATKEYIERSETNHAAVLREIATTAIVGWENILDDETGDPIPYSKEQLRAFLNEGGEFFAWCGAMIPQALRQFDEMVKQQQEQLQKNLNGSSSDTPAA